jgi:capsid protein
LGIPYEVLIMHFSSSYTASKAAIETARQFFTDRRNGLATDFCQPVYEWFLYECVVRGIINAPGFLDDPIARAAWSGSEWIGRAPIVLDAVKDANAAEKWIDLGVKTLESVTTETTGGDWRANQEQRGRECDIRTELNITRRPRLRSRAGPGRPGTPAAEVKT